MTDQTGDGLLDFEEFMKSFVMLESLAKIDASSPEDAGNDGRENWRYV